MLNLFKSHFCSKFNKDQETLFDLNADLHRYISSPSNKTKIFHTALSKFHSSGLSSLSSWTGTSIIVLAIYRGARIQSRSDFLWTHWLVMSLNTKPTWTVTRISNFSLIEWNSTFEKPNKSCFNDSMWLAFGKRNKASKKLQAFLYRLMMGIFSGLALLVSMIVMVLSPTKLLLSHQKIWLVWNREKKNFKTKFIKIVQVFLFLKYRF